ncbi:MAG: SLC13 family permease, partial [Desulfovibrionaceae bacterium]|nr:SLC13 family permease [Desulfovibrionaceae bacterium]
EPLTPLGMNLLGIFLGVLYGWVFIEIVWPSLAGLLAMMLIGGMTPARLLNQSFGHPIVLMMFFIFVFCATINHYGLSRFISLWFITRKCVVGRPWVFTFTFLASMFILGGLTSASPAALIGWSILYGVCDVCGYRKGEGYPTMMIFGTVYATQIGQSMIPFKQVCLTVFGAYEAMSGTGIDYARYMIIACLVCVLCCLFFIAMGRYVFRPDMEKLRSLDASTLDREGSLNLNGVQKVILCFLFLLVLLLLAPSFLPSDFILSRFLTAIGNTGVVMLLVAVMAMLRVDGRPLLNFKVMVDSGVTWGIVLLLAFVQPLTIGMSSPESGITDFLMGLIMPMFGESSEIVFALVLGLGAVVLTQIMNNGAVGVVLMPVVFSFCQATGMAPEIPLIMVVMGVHYAFLTPAASASAALLHGNEWSNTAVIWKTAPIAIAGAYVSTALVTVLLGSLLY